jgi:hypothetical protein
MNFDSLSVVPDWNLAKLNAMRPNGACSIRLDLFNFIELNAFIIEGHITHNSFSVVFSHNELCQRSLAAHYLYGGVLSFDGGLLAR